MLLGKHLRCKGIKVFFIKQKLNSVNIKKNQNSEICKYDAF